MRRDLLRRVAASASVPDRSPSSSRRDHHNHHQQQQQRRQQHSGASSPRPPRTTTASGDVTHVHIAGPAELDAAVASAPTTEQLERLAEAAAGGRGAGVAALLRASLLEGGLGAAEQRAPRELARLAFFFGRLMEARVEEGRRDEVAPVGAGAAAATPRQQQQQQPSSGSSSSGGGGNPMIMVSSAARGLLGGRGAAAVRGATAAAAAMPAPTPALAPAPSLPPRPTAATAAASASAATISAELEPDARLMAEVLIPAVYSRLGDLDADDLGRVLGGAAGAVRAAASEAPSSPSSSAAVAAAAAATASRELLIAATEFLYSMLPDAPPAALAAAARAYSSANHFDDDDELWLALGDRAADLLSRAPPAVPAVALAAPGQAFRVRRETPAFAKSPAPLDDDDVGRAAAAAAAAASSSPPLLFSPRDLSSLVASFAELRVPHPRLCSAALSRAAWAADREGWPLSCVGRLLRALAALGFPAAAVSAASGGEAAAAAHDNHHSHHNRHHHKSSSPQEAAQEEIDDLLRYVASQLRNLRTSTAAGPSASSLSAAAQQRRIFPGGAVAAMPWGGASAQRPSHPASAEQQPAAPPQWASMLQEAAESGERYRFGGGGGAGGEYDGAAAVSATAAAMARNSCLPQPEPAAALQAALVDVLWSAVMLGRSGSGASLASEARAALRSGPYGRGGGGSTGGGGFGSGSGAAGGGLWRELQWALSGFDASTFTPGALASLFEATHRINDVALAAVAGGGGGSEAAVRRRGARQQQQQQQRPSQRPRPPPLHLARSVKAMIDASSRASAFRPAALPQPLVAPAFAAWACAGGGLPLPSSNAANAATSSEPQPDLSTWRYRDVDQALLTRAGLEASVARALEAGGLGPVFRPQADGAAAAGCDTTTTLDGALVVRLATRAAVVPRRRSCSDPSGRSPSSSSSSAADDGNDDGDASDDDESDDQGGGAPAVAMVAWEPLPPEACTRTFPQQPSRAQQLLRKASLEARGWVVAQLPFAEWCEVTAAAGGGGGDSQQQLRAQAELVRARLREALDGYGLELAEED